MMPGKIKTKRLWTECGCAFIAIALLLALARTANGASASQSRVVITANVLARVQLTVLRQPGMIVVSEQDVRRGYVDAESPVLTELRSNTPKGCIITIESDSPAVREMEVKTMGRTVSVHSPGGMIVLPVSGRQSVLFSFRFFLAKDALPGTYAWPVQINAMPL